MDSRNHITNSLHQLFTSVGLIPTRNRQQQQNSNAHATEGQGSSAAPDSTPGASQATDFGVPASPMATSAEDTGDVEMTAVNQGNIHDDDDEMPELQSVSDSDSEDEDLNEVEMQANYDDEADLIAVANGGGGDRLMSSPETQRPAQSQGSANPASVSSSTLPRPNRRTRVEDDDDEERDRRHPSQRVNAPRGDSSTPLPPTPASGATPATTAPHPPLGTAPPPQSQPAPQQPPPQSNFPDFMNMLFQEFRRRAEDRQNQGQPNAGNAQPQNQNGQPPPAGTPPPNTANPNPFDGAEGDFTSGFAITFDFANGAGQPIMTNVTHGQPPPWAAPQGGANNNAGDGRGPPGSRGNPIALDPDALFSFINMLNIFPGGRDVEDPERAKQLIDALEEVPVGLIRRMERVSEGVDLSGSGGEVNCAICWDRLLDPEESAGWTKKEDEHDHSHTEGENEGSSSSTETSSTSDKDVASSSTTEPSTSDPKQPKIVSLPCAHVFHADCLLPWFSRPRQTTCPTCRFNIDPENLTYRPPRRNANPNRTQTTQSPAANAGTQAASDAQPQPAATPLDPPAATAAGTANAERQTGNAAPPAGETRAEQLTRTVTALESLRDALTRRIDQAEAEERGLLEALAGNNTVLVDDDSDGEGEVIFGTDDGAGIFVPGAHAFAPGNVNANAGAAPAATNTGRNGGPIPIVPLEPPSPQATPAADANPTNPPANQPADNAQGQPTGIPAGILTIGFDVIIGPPIPGMDDPMDGDDVEDQQPPVGGQDQAQPQPAGQGQAQGQGRRFGAPFGAGLRTGGNGNVHFASGSGRTVNEAFASLFANNFGGGAGNAGGPGPTTAATPTPIIFGPPRPPPTQGEAGPPRPQSAPPPTGGNAPNAPTNNGRNGPAPDALNIGQIFNRLFNLGGQQGQGQAQGQGQGTAAPPPQARAQGPPTQLPPFLNVNNAGTGAAPTANAQTAAPGGGAANANLPPLQQHFANMFGGVPGFPPGGVFVGGTNAGNAGAPGTGAGAPRTGPARPPRERRKWVLPAPPGPTLRQRIEKAEREAGLRCFDVSCGVGPSDEEPFTTLTVAAKKQLSIQDAEDKHDGAPISVRNVCQHTFHPSCLVSAARVALMGEDATLVNDGERVEVACSVCRSEGSVLKHDWDEGVVALQ